MPYMFTFIKQIEKMRVGNKERNREEEAKGEEAQRSNVPFSLTPWAATVMNIGNNENSSTQN